MSDTQITQLLKNKNQQAIAEILEKYGNALYGIIYREVGEESVAKNVMNTLCLEAWKNAQEYEHDKEQLFTWLTKLVHKILYKHTRSVEKGYLSSSILEKLTAA